MDSAALRALQAPIKDRYKADAKAGLITLKAKGVLDDTNIACKVETGRALAVAGLHPATGGSGLELCSGDMLLEALVACGAASKLTYGDGAARYDIRTDHHYHSRCLGCGRITDLEPRGGEALRLERRGVAPAGAKAPPGVVRPGAYQCGRNTQ